MYIVQTFKGKQMFIIDLFSIDVTKSEYTGSGKIVSFFILSGIFNHKLK